MADEYAMKSSDFLKRIARAAVVAGFGALSAPPAAWAFHDSEDQQFEAEIHEAKVRAQDFEKYLQRSEREERDREAASKGMGAERVREEAERAAVQKEFAKKNADVRLREEAEREALEKQWDEQQLKEAQQDDVVRKEYVAKRDRVRRVLSREAYIDEAREYGL